MHRTRHRAPVKRDSWYIGWKEKLGGGVKELESWKKKKNNSARVNERESTGRGEKNLVFFFTRAGEKLRGKFRIESCREKKQWKQVESRKIGEREDYILERLRDRERDKRRKSILAVSIYFSCFSTLRFSLGNMGRKRGEARLFTPALSRLRNAAAV